MPGELSPVVIVLRRRRYMSTRRAACTSRWVHIMLSYSAAVRRQASSQTAYIQSAATAPIGQPSTTYHFSCTSICPVRQLHLPVL